MKKILFPFLVGLILSGCGVNKSSFNSLKKYSPERLNEDYRVFETLVKEKHPGLYWYASPGQIDSAFATGKEALRDSMTERNFRKVLSYVYSTIDCGHSSVRPSRKYERRLDSLRLLAFPLSLKIWKDTAVVTGNLNRKDSILTRGTVITAIDSVSIEKLADTMFRYIPSDGYNLTHKYQTLSNGGSFGTIYTTLFGLKKNYTIDYIDSLGQHQSLTVPVFDPRKDSSLRRAISRYKQVTKKERKKRTRELTRHLETDSLMNTGYMTLNSFSNGTALKHFFRTSFRRLRKMHIQNLVIDVRGNGGGNVGNSTLLTKYIAQKPFKLADSLYAVNRRSDYRKYIQHDFFNRLFISFFTRKKADGKYHFTYFEHHFFTPKKKNHFNGTVYIVTGGNSFSATTIFTILLKDQENVWVVGEETGGGAYGNTAWLIPDVKLPNTGVRFRLPLFRLVINKNAPKNGRGIQPEVEATPSVKAIKDGVDYKMEKVNELIKEKNKKDQSSSFNDKSSSNTAKDAG